MLGRQFGHVGAIDLDTPGRGLGETADHAQQRRLAAARRSEDSEEIAGKDFEVEGPDRFDGLTALERWVEADVAPERIIASKLEDGEVVRTRPLCPYPQVARWNGTGSTDDAANFACVAPER